MSNTTAEELFEQMIGIMPYKLPLGNRAYIVEAIETHSTQQLTAAIEGIKGLSTHYQTPEATVALYKAIAILEKIREGEKC